MADPFEQLVARARAARSTLVVTGAGVSLASGIPTFRGTDPGAVWARDVMELGTNAYFKRDPVGSWQFYLRRFDAVRHAAPNPAHTALAEWERVAKWTDFLLVTQNVDTLHRAAGSEYLVEVHGRADRIRCSRTGCVNGAPRGSLPRDRFDLDPFRKDPSRENIPRCPACNSLMRQHVLWFDETYDQHEDYQIGRALVAAKNADLVVFAGTSFSVGLTEMVLRFASNPFTIDPAGLAPHPDIVVVPEAAEVAFPRLVERLKG